MRPDLWEPDGEITDEVLANVLSLASVTVPEGVIAQWAPLERLLAYDWAMREHYAASDSLNKRRDKPWFITVASGSGASRHLRHLLKANDDTRSLHDTDALFRRTCELAFRMLDATGGTMEQANSLYDLLAGSKAAEATEARRQALAEYERLSGYVPGPVQL